MSKNLVKWVCNNCGANNINHKALIYQCAICQKIASEEVISPIKDKRILDSTLEMKALSRRITMKEKVRILFGKKPDFRFGTLIRVMEIVSIAVSLFCAFIVFNDNPFSSMNFIDNIRMMNYVSIGAGVQNMADIVPVKFEERVDSFNQNAEIISEIDLASVGDSVGILFFNAGKKLGQGHSNLESKEKGWADVVRTTNDNLDECFANMGRRVSSLRDNISSTLQDIFD